MEILLFILYTLCPWIDQGCNLFTIQRASDMKVGAKVCCFHPLHPERYIDTIVQDSIKIKNRKNNTCPSSTSCTLPCLGSIWPISALIFDSSANADPNHVLLSYFIISPAHCLYFSEPTCFSPDPVLDAGSTRCKPVLCRSRCRPHSCSR